MIRDPTRIQFIGLRCSGAASHSLCWPLYRSERRSGHVTEELFSLTFALHFCFVPDGTGRARASVSPGGGDEGLRSPVVGQWYVLRAMQSGWGGGGDTRPVRCGGRGGGCHTVRPHTSLISAELGVGPGMACPPPHPSAPVRPSRPLPVLGGGGWRCSWEWPVGSPARLRGGTWAVCSLPTSSAPPPPYAARQYQGGGGGTVRCARAVRKVGDLGPTFPR